MEPAVLEREAFRLVGMEYRGRNENGECSRLWNEFRTRVPEIKNRVHNDVFYGFETFDVKSQELIYLAAVEVSDLADLPAGMSTQLVPASRYAVFPIPAVMKDIPKAIGEVYERRLPASGLEGAADWDFEYYDRDFVPNSAAACLHLYVPIK